jgi:ribosome-interacting GTPase 1
MILPQPLDATPMPANLTPEYLEAEQHYKSAKSNEEKISALEEMLATIPRHKGTEKMQADLKQRLAKLRTEQSHKPASRADLIHRVEKEGAGQVALVGPPNSGKSSLVRRLTRATPEVADYPFTTRIPVPGMMQFEDVQIQLVDLPPAHPDFPESWVYQIIRNADAALLILDLGDADLLEDLETTLSELSKAKVKLDAGELPGVTGWLAKKTLLIANKVDAPGARENLDILRELYEVRFTILPVSAQSGEGLEQLRASVYDLLGIIRVYTKAPGKKLEKTAPYVLRRGSTVMDLAARVHHDFLTQLKYARVWGHGKFDGQMAHRDHVLEDKDVVELHR